MTLRRIGWGSSWKECTSQHTSSRMAKYNVERGGRAGESNKQGGFSATHTQKNNKTGLISSHTLAGPALGSNSHMLNVTVCSEIAPGRLCSCQASDAADIYHLCLTLLGVFHLRGVDAELLLCESCVVIKQILTCTCMSLAEGVCCRRSSGKHADAGRENQGLKPPSVCAHRNCIETWSDDEVTAMCDECSQVSFFGFQIDDWACASPLWMCQRVRDGVSGDGWAWLTGLPVCLPHAFCILMLPRWDWRCRDRRWRRWGVQYQGHRHANINHTSC